MRDGICEGDAENYDGRVVLRSEPLSTRRGYQRLPLPYPMLVEGEHIEHDDGIVNEVDGVRQVRQGEERGRREEARDEALRRRDQADYEGEDVERMDEVDGDPLQRGAGIGDRRCRGAGD